MFERLFGGNSIESGPEDNSASNSNTTSSSSRSISVPSGLNGGTLTVNSNGSGTWVDSQGNKMNLSADQVNDLQGKMEQ